MKKFVLIYLLSAFFCDSLPAQIFTKISNTPLNLAVESEGNMWADYDKDGDMDVLMTIQAHYTVSANPTKSFYLFQNNCGTFTRMTTGDLVNDTLNGSGTASWVDVDNDGYEDVLAITESNPKKKILYHNNGNATFTKITNLPFLYSSPYTISSSFVDMDNDGDLDIYYANEDIYSLDVNAAHDVIYRNDGNGNYALLNTILDSTSTRNGAWGDYDNDGFMDLFISTLPWSASVGVTRLFHNNGDGTFAHVSNITKSTVTANYSYGASFVDFDNDSDLDIFLVNATGHQNKMFQNDGAGNFTDVTIAAGLTDNRPNNDGHTWGDIDNDGDLDLFLTSFNRNMLYINNGNGTFTENTTEVAVNEPIVESTGPNFVDFDKDGDMDLLVSNNNLAPENYFYTNNGNNNHWIGIRAKGVTSNREAIGARIYLKATINGQPKWQMREINANPYAQGRSSISPEVHFGTGNAGTIDSIKVVWPVSGTSQYFTNVNPNRFIEISEGSSVLNEVTHIVAVTPASVNICKGGSTTLAASGAGVYSWSPSTGLNTAAGATVIANPISTTTYTVTGTTGSCVHSTQVTVIIDSACSSISTLVLDGACINLNGGTNTNPVFLVVDNNNTTGISHLSGNGITTGGQYDFIKWKAGSATGNLVFPFGAAGTNAAYIPFVFNKTTEENADITVSTWSTNTQNMPHPGISTVPAVTAMTGPGDSLTTALDRFWDIRTSAYATADLTFSYRAVENTTSSPATPVTAQRWTAACSAWASLADLGYTGVSTGTGTVGPMLNQSAFSPVVLTRVAAPLVVIKNTPLANSGGPVLDAFQGIPLVIGGNPSVSCGTPPYTYLWSPSTFLSSATVANPVATPTVAITYTLTVTDANNRIATSTVSVTANTASAYASLKRNIDGSYYTLDKGMLFFKYDEEYTDSDGKLTYKIYNQLSNQLLFSSNNVQPVDYGDNRYGLNVKCLNNGLMAGYYLLEISNEKEEKFYLRFKNTQSIFCNCNGCYDVE